MAEGLITVAELEHRLGVSHDAIYRKLDEIPHYRFGVKILFDWDEVLESLREKDVA